MAKMWSLSIFECSWMTATNTYIYFLIYEPLPVFLIIKCLLQEPLQQVQINKTIGKVVAAQERLGRGVL